MQFCTTESPQLFEFEVATCRTCRLRSKKAILEVATSNLQKWWGFVQSWGPCMPIWHLLLYIPTKWHWYSALIASDKYKVGIVCLRLWRFRVVAWLCVILSRLPMSIWNYFICWRVHTQYSNQSSTTFSKPFMRKSDTIKSFRKKESRAGASSELLE